jgi:hypothetical protein
VAGGYANVALRWRAGAADGWRGLAEDSYPRNPDGDPRALDRPEAGLLTAEIADDVDGEVGGRRQEGAALAAHAGTIPRGPTRRVRMLETAGRHHGSGRHAASGRCVC